MEGEWVRGVEHDLRDSQRPSKDSDFLAGAADTDSGYSEDIQQEISDPFHGLYGVRMPYYFLIMALLALPLYTWPWRWWHSGAPLLSMALLSGRLGRLSKSPSLLILSLFIVNFAYVLFSTSWLFYDFYVIVCYPTALFLAIISSRRSQRAVRRFLRVILGKFHFYEDKLAFFDLPALNIDDGEVPCLLVVRGFTFKASTMNLEVHGIEVGVKINDDIEIAIQTDRFTWEIMRRITIGDIYAQVKGPLTEKNKHHHDDHQNKTDAENSLTNGGKPQTTRNFSSIKTHGDYDDAARKLYSERLEGLRRTNIINRAKERLSPHMEGQNRLRAALGASTHEEITVPNPQKMEMKSSELTAMVPGWLKFIFKNCRVLLRLFLNSISYNHPVHFQAITLTGCGRYLNQILGSKFFQQYDDYNKEINKLKEDVNSYLGDGKFSVVLPDIYGLASVPFLTSYDIITYVKAPKVLIFKSTQDSETKTTLDVADVAEIGGFSATFGIPSCLLPNHEDLIPDPPRDPHEPDVVNIKMALLMSLPGKLHPDMIAFASTMVKASQVLTLHKQTNSMSTEVKSIGDFTKALGGASKEQLKKKLVEAHVDDDWFNKLLVKGFNFLHSAKGDVGYQMDIPQQLDELRLTRSFVRRSTGSTFVTPDQSRRSSTMSEFSTGSGTRLAPLESIS